jgi:hypothetical protein
MTRLAGRGRRGDVTKRHRERHEAHLKKMVSACMAEQMACWPERAVLLERVD